MTEASLQLSLRLDPADTFGAMEWVLANARRTGLALRECHVVSAVQSLARLTVTSNEADLLHLFVRRLGNGIDVEVLDAEFSDDEPAPANPAAREPAAMANA